MLVPQDWDNLSRCQAIELCDRTILPQLFEKSAVYEPTWQNLALNWGILGLHAAVYLTATLLLQKRKDIFK